jgi:membrane-associated phospholipid phosphatase
VTASLKQCGVLPKVICVAVLMALADTPGLLGQAGETPRKQTHDSARVIRWKDALWAAGGVAVISLIDQPVQRATQKHRSNTLESFAKVFREEGSPVYYGSVSLGVLSVGLISGNNGIKRAGGRLVATVVASAIVMEASKKLIGRSRPNANAGAYDFHPFTTRNDSTGVEQRESMPSGHVTAAFAVATSVVDDIHNVPISILLYTWASGAAFSRVYENRHWVSDTVMGAILGITTAKLINGHWRVFDLKPPRFLISPSGAMALGWNVSF